MKNIYIIGIGLIGGSLAIDIKKKNPDVVIHGISRKDATLESALSLKLIDKKATLDDITNADLVIVAIPVDATVKLLPTILDKISDNGSNYQNNKIFVNGLTQTSTVQGMKNDVLNVGEDYYKHIFSDAQTVSYDYIKDPLVVEGDDPLILINITPDKFGEMVHINKGTPGNDMPASILATNISGNKFNFYNRV